MSLSGLHYRDATLTVVIERTDNDSYVVLNDVEQEEVLIPSGASGPQHITIGLPPTS